MTGRLVKFSFPRISFLRNVFSNWADTGASVIYSLTITPIVVHALQREQYGIWSFLNGLLAYSNLMYMGLGAALIRFVSQHHANGNREALNRLASVVLTVYTVVGISCVSVLLAGASYVPRILKDLAGPDLTHAAIVTTSLLGIQLFVMFVGSAFSGILVAEGRADLFNCAAISETILRFVSVPIFVSGPNSLIALAGVVVATSVIRVSALAFLAYRVDPLLKLRLSVPRLSELRVLYGFGLFAFLMQVSDRVISFTDTTVIGVTIGAGAVALYALPLQLVQYSRLVVYGIGSVLVPHLTPLHTTKRAGELADAYVDVVRTVAIISAFLNINMIFLGPSFLKLWIGPEYAAQAGIILIFLGIAGFLQSVSTQCQIPFCETLGTLRFPTLVLMVEALINLGLSLVFVRPLGLAGVALATAIPALLVSFVFVPSYVCSQLHIPLARVIRSALVPVVILSGALIACHVMLNRCYNTDTYMHLASKAGVAVTVAGVFMMVGASPKEKQVLSRIVQTFTSPMASS